jgi:hypothetical protein
MNLESGKGLKLKTHKTVADYWSKSPFLPSLLTVRLPADAYISNIMVMSVGCCLAFFLGWAASFFDENIGVIVILCGGVIFVGDFWSRYNIAMVRFYRARKE